MANRRSPQRRGLLVVRYLRRLVLAVVVMMALATAGIGVIAYREITRSLPALDPIVEYQPPVVSQVFADDGTLIAEFFSERRYLVPIERIPRLVREAFIAAEDDGFYRHQGIDVISMLRALFNNVVAGSKVQGASTITQQVVRSLLLTPTKSYERKIKEIILALRLERELSKDHILGLYLNHIYLGSGTYGVGAAAREYFGKSIEELTLAEAALLAGLPQAPSNYSPFQHWPRAKARQRYVLNRMYQASYISRQERDEALRQPLALATRRGSFRAAAHFVEQVRRDLEERLGYNGLYELGLRIYTTVNLDMQRAAEAALRSGLKELTDRQGGYRNSFRDMAPEQRDQFLRQQKLLLRGESLDPAHSFEALVTSVRGATARVQVGSFTGELVPGPDGGALPKLQPNDLVLVRLFEDDDTNLKFVLDQSPPVEGALVAVEPRTGFVKAMIGGYDFDRSSFNRATQARRQPGSAFKPLVYAAALDRNFSMASVVIDEPIYFQTAGKTWSPQNFERKYFGPTTLHTALVQSRNVVTVKITHAMGVKYLVNYLTRFGLRGEFAPNLSIALGSAELTPMELAAAYSTFANGGRQLRPIMIREISDHSGRILERNDPVLTEGIPPETAYVITNVLQDAVAHGTGRRASGLGRPTAGKTGTTNDQNDAWFVGYTPQLLAAVWVGFDVKRSLGKRETGGRVAAPIWKSFMEVATKDAPVVDFERPPGVTCIGSIDDRRECFKRGSGIGSPEEGFRVTRRLSDEGQPLDEERRDQPSALDFLREDF
jgi:penicillin-binding protein 1A